VLTDTSLRATLVERGFERAKMYSWEKSVRRVWEIYAEVIAEDHQEFPAG